MVVFATGELMRQALDLSEVAQAELTVIDFGGERREMSPEALVNQRVLLVLLGERLPSAG